jgi:hypothetical protein
VDSLSQLSMSTLLSSCDRLDHAMARLPHLPSRRRARIGGAQISWTYAGLTVNADLLAFPKLTCINSDALVSLSGKKERPAPGRGARGPDARGIHLPR